MNSDMEMFVDVWIEAHKLGKNMRWIADQLGIHRATVERRARRLRRVGVKLPPLKFAHTGPVDVDKLNQIIEELV